MRGKGVCSSLAVVMFVAASTAWLPTTVLAQGQTGAVINGVVKDVTGAVMPGVTVEASSPALIEKVRTAVSDGQGLYQIIDLRPGVYTVTFTLPGFSTVQREGIELTAALVVTVNVELRIGSLAETITVSGQSPLVDVQNTVQHQSFTRAAMDTLPTAKNFANLAALIPGVTVAGASGTPNVQDVGGTMGERNPTLVIHGSKASDMPMYFDGMPVNNVFGTGSGTATVWFANNGMVEEISVETGGAATDASSSGIRVNQIAKQGGNKFSGFFYGAFTNFHLQSDNLNAAQIARGGSRYQMRKIWDINPAFGGPLKRDKFWFYTSYRDWGSTDRPPGAFFDLKPGDFEYTPDPSQPAENNAWVHATNLRLTWQTFENQKLMIYADNLRICTCGQLLSSAYQSEAALNKTTPMNNTIQARWAWIASNRLMLELGQSYRPEIFKYLPRPGAAADGISAIDTGRGVTFRALPIGTTGSNFDQTSRVYNGKFVVSYVTGSSTLKMGSNWLSGKRIRTNNGTTSYTLSNGVPTAVTYASNPSPGHDNVKLNLGLFVQEQHTFQRLTVNAGVRYDHLNTYIPAQQTPATRYAGPRSFPRYDNLPNWKDISPRVGATYDLFGTGRTALKMSVGKYLEAQAVGISEVVNPMLTAFNAVYTRQWNDVNRDFIPQESELGASSNVNFGTSKVGIGYAPNAVDGWGVRSKNWETTAGVQQQLLDGLSASAMFNRRSFGNFRGTDNLAVTPADYDPFCVTGPVDARLPGGGGTQICGLYDLSPSRFGQNDNSITLSKNFGVQTERYTGVDISAQLRLPGGVTLQGGTSTGHVVLNNCFVIDSPQRLLNCDVTPPFQTQAKVAGIFPLPWWGLQASATFQSLAGPEITASWAAPATAVTGLTRPLSGAARTVPAVPLIKPGTTYGERLNQVDVRFSKDIRAGAGRFQTQFDLYNLFNANAVVRLNATYGANWQQPTAILGGRTLKFGIQMTL